MKVLVTGTAGFIGSFVAMRLAEQGAEVVGIDNINEYYDIRLKFGRLERAGISREDAENGKWVQSTRYGSYRFKRMDLRDRDDLYRIFAEEKFERVCHLAAQAGVRYSLSNPHSYVHSNIEGFLNILECSRHFGIEHLVYASSSSVYGLNEKFPFSTKQNVDHPVSLYAATKKSNELMAHTYSHLFRIPSTGLRYFTVYGPWGRPDMALFLFTKAILEGRPIDVYNQGNMKRDFTYIDDIVTGTLRILDSPPKGDPHWGGKNSDPASSSAPYRLYNIGNNAPVELMDFIKAIERTLGRKARQNFLPMQPGDVPVTWADVNDLARDFSYAPSVPVYEGVKRFVEWYVDYYGCKVQKTGSKDKRETRFSAENAG